MDEDDSGEFPADNRIPIALPLPEGAGALDAETTGTSLSMTFAADESVEDVRDAYQMRLMKAGYEMNESWITRGRQKMSMKVEGGVLNLSMHYPDVAPPLPPTEQLRDITSDSEDTLTLTYDRAEDEYSSLSTLKTYIPLLTDSGWEVPINGGVTATKLGQTIDFDTTDEKVLKLTVSLPGSSSGAS
ncbi:hypothetical protein ACF064_32700 [Streptomyces sp. NPDC015492]|uniref:hypothetical protein n=1 Tax=Streptomyces sp. NPDC015492 TaxID=3364958 RepID=UPI0036F74241